MTELVLNCQVVEERGLVERYVARTLDEENVRAFEIHYLGCMRCQADVRAGVSLREALVEPPRSRPRHLRVGAAGLALAAALVAVLVIPRTSAREPLTRLGGTLEPPVYLGVPVRSTAEDSLFMSGMAAYSSRRYHHAADRLAGVRGAAAIPAGFFRASSLLMTGEADEAAAAFSSVIASGASPYLAEAHFYRAKAHLRRGRADEALADLVAASSDPVIAERARALADSVRGVSER